QEIPGHTGVDEYERATFDSRPPQIQVALDPCEFGIDPRNPAVRDLDRPGRGPAQPHRLVQPAALQREPVGDLRPGQVKTAGDTRPGETQGGYAPQTDHRSRRAAAPSRRPRGPCVRDPTEHPR